MQFYHKMEYEKYNMRRRRPILPFHVFAIFGLQIDPLGG